MCLVHLNETTDKQLAELTRIGDNKDQKWVKRLVAFAEAANVNASGPFDNSAGALKHMPVELRHIRHYSIGRHRIYVIGSHKNCFYEALMIKIFKRTGELSEGSGEFQGIIKSAIADERNFFIEPSTCQIVPLETEEEVIPPDLT